MLLVEAPKLFVPNHENVIRNIHGSDNGNILLKHVLIITAEEKNGNGRVYPAELWKRETEKFVSKIKAKTTECVGELDHPESSIINLKNGSHIIRSLVWEGKECYSDIEILCDPGPKGNEAGRILGSYLRNDLAVGFSTRGQGSLKQKGEVMEVQDDFDFITVDAVSNPSNQGSWSKLNESLDKSKSISYDKVNEIITEILCSNGTCPVF